MIPTSHCSKAISRTKFPTAPCSVAVYYKISPAQCLMLWRIFAEGSPVPIAHCQLQCGTAL